MGRYPDDWDQRRKYVYKRDNYQCQNCGKQGGPFGNAELHAHHRRPVSKGGSHQTQNLATVCKRCHEQIHGHRIPTGSSSKKGRLQGGRTSKDTQSGSVEGFTATVIWFLLMVVGGSFAPFIPRTIESVYGTIWLIGSTAIAYKYYSRNKGPTSSGPSIDLFGPYTKMVVGFVNILNIMRGVEGLIFVAAGLICLMWGVKQDIEKPTTKERLTERQTTLWPIAILLSLGSLLPFYIFHKYVRGREYDH